MDKKTTIMMRESTLLKFNQFKLKLKEHKIPVRYSEDVILFLIEFYKKNKR